MNTKDKIRIIIELVIRDIANFFPYFFLLYFFIFIMSFFSILWKSFWGVPVLHISLIIFGLVFVFKKFKSLYIYRFNLENSRKFFIQIFKKSISKIEWTKYFENLEKIKIIFKTFLSYKKILRFFKYIFFLVYKFIIGLFYLIKFLIPRIIKFFWNTLKSIWRKIINGYFISWSGGIALFFFVLCPFLLVFKKTALAEKTTIYAYYFLVISVVFVIIENIFNKKPENTEDIGEKQ